MSDNKRNIELQATRISSAGTNGSSLKNEWEVVVDEDNQHAASLRTPLIFGLTTWPGPMG